MASVDSQQHPFATAPDGGEPFIRLVNASRSFGNTKALQEANLDLAVRGQMHALVGENGAGKSTCLGLVSGRIAPSSGTILVEGRELETGSPRASIQAGIATIYQELTIVPALSPQANIFLGQTLSRRGWLRERQMRREYEQLCGRLGVEPVDATHTGRLSIADQQLIEIMRALNSTAQAILLDEPTAALAEHEREVLFKTLHGLRAQGLALTLVSHNLDEVLEHSDIVTVLRDGQVVAQRPTREWTKRDLVSAMLGSTDRGAAIAAGSHRARKPQNVELAMTAEPIMKVRGLTSLPKPIDVSFDLRRGEILGIAGLVGSGRTELLRALAGLDEWASGTVEIGGSDRVPKSVREARDRGIALLPEDRKGQGLVMPRSAADNVTLGEWEGLSRMSMLSTRKVEEDAAGSAAHVGFDVQRIAEKASSFSGGNQQKLMLARWLHTDHPVLLADEPTRGVDIGAKAEILLALERLVGKDRSMIVVSSEMEEVVGLSDRVLVLHFGHQVALLDAAEEEITVEKILQLIFHSNVQAVTVEE
jgi:ABC-type sugar transport system ATPase subunit